MATFWYEYVTSPSDVSRTYSNEYGTRTETPCPFWRAGRPNGHCKPARGTRNPLEIRSSVSGFGKDINRPFLLLRVFFLPGFFLVYCTFCTLKPLRGPTDPLKLSRNILAVVIIVVIVLRDLRTGRGVS
eukprot:scaffold296723_cov41-Prasinocladus_malaysianus.AAC.1